MTEHNNFSTFERHWWGPGWLWLGEFLLVSQRLLLASLHLPKTAWKEHIRCHVAPGTRLRFTERSGKIPLQLWGKILIFRTILLRTLMAQVGKGPLGTSVPSAARTRHARGLFQSGHDVVLCKGVRAMLPRGSRTGVVGRVLRVVQGPCSGGGGGDGAGPSGGIRAMGVGTKCQSCDKTTLPIASHFQTATWGLLVDSVTFTAGCRHHAGFFCLRKFQNIHPPGMVPMQFLVMWNKFWFLFSLTPSLGTRHHYILSSLNVDFEDGGWGVASFPDVGGPSREAGETTGSREAATSRSDREGKASPGPGGGALGPLGLSGQPPAGPKRPPRFLPQACPPFLPVDATGPPGGRSWHVSCGSPK